MNLQKPTVLDAARIAAELAPLFKNRLITGAFLRGDEIGVYLEVDGNFYLHFFVEKRYAYCGLVESVPTSERKSIQAISGYTIRTAIQQGHDRIIRLGLDKNDRLGRKTTADLILELIPNKGNCTLIDDNNKIKWSLRRRESELYRPPQPLKKPTVLNLHEHEGELTEYSPTEMTEKIYGLNPLDIRNLTPESYSKSADLLAAIKQYALKASKPGAAWLIRRGDEIAGYSLVFPKIELDEAAQEFDSALALYPYYYKAAANRSAEESRHANLIGVLEKEIKVRQNKLASLIDEIGEAGSAETLKFYGELILAHIDEIKKGMKSITLPNFEGGTPEKIEIPLDPSKVAAANANDYFAKFKKATSSLKVLEKRRESTQRKLADLEELQKENSGDPDLLENELLKRGLVQNARAMGRKIAAKRLPYKRFLSSNGWEILVGRTSSDNDELTFKIARRDDYWFHAWQAAGSHTVLRLPDKNATPDKRTLEEAAALAAYYSKARTSGKVPVAYTQAKYVRKPRNSAPGKVMVEREKQLMVRPADIKKYRSDI